MRGMGGGKGRTGVADGGQNQKVATEKRLIFIEKKKKHNNDGKKERVLRKSGGESGMGVSHSEKNRNDLH